MKNILIEKLNDNKLWIIKINREHVANAIEAQTASELYEAFQSFEEDQSSCMAILTGTGKYFCSGADLKEISKNINLYQGKGTDENLGSMNVVSKDGPGPLGPTRMLLSKPVIAAINGTAVAGGFELLLWCDLRVTSKDCEMGVYCRRFGVPLIDGGTYRLPALIGLSRAMDLILTGRTIRGEEGYNIGLINILTERDNVLKESIRLAQNLISFPQTCLRNDRMSCLRNSFILSQMIETEYSLGVKTLQSKEALKGSLSFLKGLGKHGRPIAKF